MDFYGFFMMSTDQTLYFIYIVVELYKAFVALSNPDTSENKYVATISAYSCIYLPWVLKYPPGSTIFCTDLIHAMVLTGTLKILCSICKSFIDRHKIQRMNEGCELF